jgi:formylglycine-generating enzyme required for sulfatase activity
MIPKSFRVLRGGVWNVIACYARCAYRVNHGYPSIDNFFIGFRCARGL